MLTQSTEHKATYLSCFCTALVCTDLDLLYCSSLLDCLDVKKFEIEAV